MIEALHIA